MIANKSYTISISPRDSSNTSITSSLDLYLSLNNPCILNTDSMICTEITGVGAPDTITPELIKLEPSTSDPSLYEYELNVTKVGELTIYMYYLQSGQVTVAKYA